jgi:hypothetical protein
MKKKEFVPEVKVYSNPVPKSKVLTLEELEG